MTSDELLEEGRRLARKSFLLAPGDGPVVATWGGEDELGARPLLTVDLRTLRVGVHGAMMLALRGEQPIVTLTDAMRVPRNAVELIAVEAQSLPPIADVFLRGSERVGEWLKSLGWRREWDYNDNFVERTVVEAYERHYRSSCPLYTERWWAVVGGWAPRWPEDDTPPDGDFVCLTLRDAEPWYEVWSRHGHLDALSRRT